MEQLERAEKRLNLYYKAEEAILTGQEYTIGTKRLRRADLADVQAMIKTLEKEVQILKAGGKNRALRGIPLDI
ncbi:MAG: DUF6148 family protein [Butyrivibrio sp.]|nr:DUF6148 family protein [Butyrivibrio sp.]